MSDIKSDNKVKSADRTNLLRLTVTSLDLTSRGFPQQYCILVYSTHNSRAFYKFYIYLTVRKGQSILWHYLSNLDTTSTSNRVIDGFQWTFHRSRPKWRIIHPNIFTTFQLENRLEYVLLDRYLCRHPVAVHLSRTRSLLRLYDYYCQKSYKIFRHPPKKLNDKTFALELFHNSTFILRTSQPCSCLRAY